MTFWTGLGVVLSMLSDKEGVTDVSRRKTITARCAWTALFAVFLKMLPDLKMHKTEKGKMK